MKKKTKTQKHHKFSNATIQKALSAVRTFTLIEKGMYLPTLSRTRAVLITFRDLFKTVDGGEAYIKLANLCIKDIDGLMGE